MTAIKWYLFGYRLHFNQISLNYTVVNAQSTVPNAVNCAECTLNCSERTVNCALDIVNRMMSYILYLSLRWSYEVGSCTIAISVMTAIKHYLFSYRLHFNQIFVKLYSGERKVNCAERTVKCAKHTLNSALDIVNRMMSYILYMSLRLSHEVGVEPLRSVWWQLSNDLYFVIE